MSAAAGGIAAGTAVPAASAARLPAVRPIDSFRSPGGRPGVNAVTT